MTSLIVRLEPLVAPRESLMEGIACRPSIALWSRTRSCKTTRADDDDDEDDNDDKHDNGDDQGDGSLLIGRGELTGINDRSIGRHLLRLNFDESAKRNQMVKITLLNSDKSRVHINQLHWRGGTSNGKIRYLKSGDILSLDNLRYEYKVVVSTTQTQTQTQTQTTQSQQSQSRQCSALAAPSSSSAQATILLSSATTQSPPPQHLTLSTDVMTKLNEDVQCSVCLEIQVHSQTIHPCGHCFCKTCLDGIENICPNCRQAIRHVVPARQLDSLIETLAGVPGLLDPEDVQHYQERIMKTTTTTALPPSSIEVRMIFMLVFSSLCAFSFSF
jgi:hypothetical protein